MRSSVPKVVSYSLHLGLSTKLVPSSDRKGVTTTDFADMPFPEDDFKLVMETLELHQAYVPALSSELPHCSTSKRENLQGETLLCKLS